MSNLYKDAPVVKVVMLKGKDGAKSKLSELTNDMTFLTQEQITTLVNNIIDTGSVGDIDTGFVTRLVEQNKGKALKFWIGTQAEYNALTTKIANTFYIITDDSFKTDVLTAINDLQAQINAIIQTDYETEISALQETTQELNETTEQLSADITELKNINYPVYKAGDFDVITIQTAGYVTNNGRNIYFNVPLTKFLGIDKLIDYSEILDEEHVGGVYITVRQKGRYFVGSAESREGCNDFVTLTPASAYGEMDGTFSLNVRLINNDGFYDGTTPIDNNDTVGIDCQIRMKITEVN